VLSVKQQNGAAIKARRQAKDIKLREMARRIGVDAGFLCHVEAERCYASQRTLVALAGQLECDVAEITRRPE
jgi:transcriptional regulator with XRE-family HTH domain